MTRKSYEVLTEEIRKDREKERRLEEFKRKREMTSLAKGPWYKNFGIQEPNIYKHSFSFELAKADLERKKGRFDKSLSILDKLSRYGINDVENFPAMYREQYIKGLKSISSRVNRIANQAYGKGNLHEAEKAVYLENRLEQKINEEEKKSLSKKLAVFISSFIGLAGIFFLSGNITGNVIANLNSTDSNIVGSILFIVGIIGVAFFLKR